MSEKRKSSIEKLCKSLSSTVKVTVIKPSMYLQSMGYIAGISGFKRTNTNYTGPDFESEMLVFSGMDSSLMDEFLESMKKAGFPPIALKAIITPTNIFWTPAKLYDELCKEHHTMMKR